jgi:hypothetical protein
MNNTEIVIAIVALVAGIALSASVFIPLLKKKGVKTDQIIDEAQAGLKTADIIVDGVQAALPDLPGIKIVHEVIELASKGADAVEQKKKSGQITTEQRKETAIQFVKDCLTAANVEITPDIEKIIDGAVEAAVFALPKTATAA